MILRSLTCIALAGLFFSCNSVFGQTEEEPLEVESIEQNEIEIAENQNRAEEEMVVREEIERKVALQEVADPVEAVQEVKEPIAAVPAEAVQETENPQRESAQDVQFHLANVQLQQLLQHLGQHQHSLGRTLEMMERLEMQTLNENLSTSQAVFDAAEKFASALKEHMAELEKRIQEVDAAKSPARILRATRDREVGARRLEALGRQEALGRLQNDAWHNRNPERAKHAQHGEHAKRAEMEEHARHAEHAMVQMEMELAKKEMEMDIAKKEMDEAKQAAAAAETYRRKMAEVFRERAEAERKLHHDLERQARQAGASSEESPPPARWAEMEARLERIERALEKLTAEKEQK